MKLDNNPDVAEVQRQNNTTCKHPEEARKSRFGRSGITGHREEQDYCSLCDHPMGSTKFNKAMRELNWGT